MKTLESLILSLIDQNDFKTALNEPIRKCKVSMCTLKLIGRSYY